MDHPQANCMVEHINRYVLEFAEERSLSRAGGTERVLKIVPERIISLTTEAPFWLALIRISFFLAFEDRGLKTPLFSAVF